MVPTGNTILDGLSEPLLARIVSASRPCRLPRNTVLMEQGKAPTTLVFLTSGMASQIVRMGDGDATEAGMLGRESVTGMSTLLGSDLHHNECIVQIPGGGLQVPRRLLVELFASSSEFRDTMLQHVQREFNIALRTSACNLQHDSRARFARWLLTASDRTQSQKLSMTHEFLAELLGTRRPTVSEVVGSLQRLGLVHQHRGTIVIHDRAGLLQIACECYEVCRVAMYGDSDESLHSHNLPIRARLSQ